MQYTIDIQKYLDSLDLEVIDFISAISIKDYNLVEVFNSYRRYTGLTLAGNDAMAIHNLSFFWRAIDSKVVSSVIMTEYEFQQLLTIKWK